MNLHDSDEGFDEIIPTSFISAMISTLSPPHPTLFLPPLFPFPFRNGIANEGCIQIRDKYLAKGDPHLMPLSLR